MAKVGYARVSTHDQNIDLQMLALRGVCCRVFEDHGISGAKSSRPGLNAILRFVRRGDTLVVWRLDRLGRSIHDLLRIIERLRKRGVEFQSLTEHIDTGSAGGRLVFHLLAAMAEFERQLIRERTLAGIEAARARGTRLGRRPRLNNDERVAAYHAVIIDGENATDVAKRYRVHPRTLARHIERMRCQ
ncbi:MULTISPECIES: recombinase family protein [Rhizobium]|uniref:DNA-invertase n=1 Tax=Rhizobium johnstonii (strain DSM 114642 / LMG 32736 / 3841) TaxID=216596 RepID=Q1MHA6_RHIJ3|nr:MULTISPECIES: recombinase family protein [Rhizobium]NEI92366.1 recombinase family protein [Rhizobium leguminosarum]NEJ79122.1 recombinase family protein [Rhizobium leguminosarum]CAK07659.1 putative DNA-invertase [Rhizobium johnstonii 3841]